jgi:hypothetical protein
MEAMISYINTHNKHNVKVLMSTPSQYIEALKKENIVFSSYYNDMFPYSDEKDEFWSGFYTSRPNTKKMVKDGSAYLHATSKAFALKAIDQKTKDEEITKILEAKDGLFDSMGVYQHHDAITGTDMEFVAEDYAYRLQRAMDKSFPEYKKILE